MALLSRRSFVSSLGIGTAGIAAAPLATFYSRMAAGVPSFGRGFGPLEAKLPLNTASLNNATIGDLRNRVLLSVPKGFDYWVISPRGDTMSDGTVVPGSHDGMATFNGPNSSTYLVRNHELTTSTVPVVTADGSTYDPTRAGGTTTLVVDNQGQLVSHYGSLAGTVRNCAGGPTPWGSWLTCEETFSVGASGLRHGYVFEVPAGIIAPPVPIPAMGRFSHEAAAVDPATGFVYLTEDVGNSLLYRYRPNAYGNLHAGGALEALRLVDWPAGINAGATFKDKLFQPFATNWVPIADPDPATDTVRNQGIAQGAATFVRGEGAWYGGGKVYFVSTSGGVAGRGQVWAYDTAASTLTLIVESVLASELPYVDPSWNDASVSGNGGYVLAAPDNVTVGPDGRLYLCEDGSGVEKVVGVNADGELFEVVRNDLNDSEFAGVCFSHDGRFMFLNLQSTGLTFVINGNWRKGQS
jgi:secreted PhoX family phosphatase